MPEAPAVAVRMEGLTKRFGPLVAVDDLTLDVARGEVFGFLGPNGAGKSTTLRLLLGLIRPTAGSGSVMGHPLGTVAAHRCLAYVPGDVALWGKLTGAECLHLIARLHGGTDEAYRRDLVERFDLDVSKRFRAYSKGNRQKVAIVAAFASRADVLLLDEPTTGLDPLMERVFRECVGEATRRGQTVFLSSHILAEVDQLCSRVGMIRAGRLVEVAQISDLRNLAASEIDVEFTGAAPDVAGLDGVTGVDEIPGGLRIHVHGSPGPVVRALAATDVTDLRTREASLEEIFLSYYGDGGPTR